MSAPKEHLLDRPIWSAPTTQQAHLAQRNARARRYPVDVAPFADMADMSPESFARLRDLMRPGEVAVLFTPEAVTVPGTFEVLLAKTGEQMIGTPADVTNTTARVVPLDASDVSGMAELVSLTNPGPFAARTHTLGTFLGIKLDDRLAAMIGERMKPGNYTEMTGICVHPDFRGRGYAQMLMRKSQSASWRVAKFRSCTFILIMPPPSRFTGARACPSAAPCMSQF